MESQLSEYMEPSDNCKFTICTNFSNLRNPNEPYECYKFPISYGSQKFINLEFIITWIHGFINLQLHEFYKFISHLRPERYIKQEFYFDFEKGETRLVRLCGVPHTIPESRNSETVESREKFHQTKLNGFTCAIVWQVIKGLRTSRLSYSMEGRRFALHQFVLLKP